MGVVYSAPSLHENSAVASRNLKLGSCIMGEGVLLLPSVPSRLRRPFRRTPSARPPVRPCFSHPPPPPLPPACYQAPPCPTCPKRCSIPRTPIPCSALPRAPLPWGLLAPPVFPFTRRGAARPSYISSYTTKIHPHLFVTVAPGRRSTNRLRDSETLRPSDPEIQKGWILLV